MRLQFYMLLLFDVISVWTAYFVGLWFRFDCRFSEIPDVYLETHAHVIPYFSLQMVLICGYFRLYSIVLSSIGRGVVFRCLFACICSVPVHLVMCLLLDVRMPVSYFAFGLMLHTFILTASRSFVRIYLLAITSWRNSSDGENTMLIGGGDAGQIILHDLPSSMRQHIAFKCIIDDDSKKWGCYIENVRVFGGRRKIREQVEKYQIKNIFVAIPSASPQQIERILSECQKTNCAVKVMPGLDQLDDKMPISLTSMKSVSVQDLLGQNPVKYSDREKTEMFQALKDKVVLITGGAGSVGTELCIQIAKYEPKKVVVLDLSENGIFVLRHRLQKIIGSHIFDFKLGSVTDFRLINRIFEQYHPDIVFHAASHKHVSLMESSVGESVINNVLGTYCVACAAVSHGCGKFVYLSTDKAVEPRSILGVSSRVCEIMMQVFDKMIGKGKTEHLILPAYQDLFKTKDLKNAKTIFTSIRFGTVLDSSGSVFHLFQEQIREDKLLKVVKGATRFCMPVTDVCALVLSGAIHAEGGKVYVIDMGEPYEIESLAVKLIQLNGLVLGKDVCIQYIQPQPGEKLHETSLMWQEGMSKTESDKIVQANATKVNPADFLEHLTELFNTFYETDEQIQNVLFKLVNTYMLPGNLNAIQHQPEEPGRVKHLETIVERFKICGTVTAAIPMSSGYINRTYRIETVDEKNKTTYKYTLQRINTNVFPDADELMKNFVNVTEHLRKNLHLSDDPGIPSNQEVIRTKSNENFYQDESGQWRMLTFIDNVHSYDIPESPKVFYYSGCAFGAFIKAMSSLNPSVLYEVIPNFHNTYSRYLDLEKVIERDPLKMAGRVMKEIETIRSHQVYFSILKDALESKQIPLRVGHNDCNLNNVLFDDTTNKPVAIIDLDTVMPSSPLYDFGDSMRIGTNPAKDDEQDLSKVFCNLELYEQYARGWLESCGNMLTKTELALLPYACIVITWEDCIRFLGDHISGDIYYHTDFYGQNLRRARTQMTLALDMIQKLPEIKSMLNRIYKELQLDGECNLSPEKEA